jgi:hypothetical protein
MLAYYGLDGFDRKASIWVLWEQPGLVPPRLREEYRDLQCPKCLRVHTLRALERGIDPSVGLSVRPTDIMQSTDRLWLVSRRTRALFNDIVEIKVRYFDLPGSDGYSVIYPDTIYYPPDSGKIYKPMERPRERDVFQIRESQCEGCGRYRSVTWRPEWFEVPQRQPLAGVMIEHNRWPGMALIISSLVRDALKTQKITGWRTYPIKGCIEDRLPSGEDATNFDMPQVKRRSRKSTGNPCKMVDSHANQKRSATRKPKRRVSSHRGAKSSQRANKTARSRRKSRTDNID